MSVHHQLPAVALPSNLTSKSSSPTHQLQAAVQHFVHHQVQLQLLYGGPQQQHDDELKNLASTTIDHKWCLAELTRFTSSTSASLPYQLAAYLLPYCVLALPVDKRAVEAERALTALTSKSLHKSPEHQLPLLLLCVTHLQCISSGTAKHTASATAVASNKSTVGSNDKTPVVRTLENRKPLHLQVKHQIGSIECQCVASELNGVQHKQSQKAATHVNHQALVNEATKLISSAQLPLPLRLQAVNLLFKSLYHSTLNSPLFTLPSTPSSKAKSHTHATAAQLPAVGEQIIQLLVDSNTQIRNITAQHLKLLLDTSNDSQQHSKFTALYGGYGNSTTIDSKTPVALLDEALVHFVTALQQKQDVARQQIAHQQSLHPSLSQNGFQTTQDVHAPLVMTAINACASLASRLQPTTRAMHQCLLVLVDGMTEHATRPAAFNTIRRLSAVHGMTPDRLCKLHKYELWRHIFKITSDNMPMLRAVCEGLLSEGRVDDYCYGIVRECIPQFLLSGDKSMFTLIDTICHSTNHDLHSTIIAELHHILSAILCCRDQQSWPNAYLAYQYLTDRDVVEDHEPQFPRFTLKQLLDTCGPIVTTSLLWKLGSSDPLQKQHAESALWLQCYPSTTSHTSPAAPPVEVQQKHPARLSSLLSTVFLQMCDEFDDVLTPSAENSHTMQEKREAASALLQLIISTDKSVSSYFAKTLHLIRMCIAYSELREIACNALYRFVTVLPLPQMLGHLSEIVVAVLPCIPKEQASSDVNMSTTTVDAMVNGVDNTLMHITQLFRYVLVDHKTVTAPLWAALPLYGVTVGIQHLELQQYLKAVQQSYTKLPFNDKLAVISQSLSSSDNSEVLLEVLQQLKSTLQTERQAMQELMLVGKSAVFISTLMQRLLKLLSVRESRIRLLSSECMGEIGAIEPSQLPKTQAAAYSHIRPAATSNDELAIELIQRHLVRAYQTASDISSQDRALYGIQELLKLLHCTPVIVKYNTAAPEQQRMLQRDIPKADLPLFQRGVENWLKFAPEVRQLITPCTESNYTYAKPVAASLDVPIRTGSVTNGSSAPQASPSHDTSSADSQVDDAFPMTQYSHARPTAQPPKAKRAKVQPVAVKPPSPPPRVFFTTHSKSFRIWMSEWCRDSIERATLDNTDRSRIYAACEGALKIDTELNMYLLPELIDNALRHGDDNAIDQVKQEITAVLQHVVLENITADRADTQQQPADGSKSARHASTSHVQAVFECIDQVEHWITTEEVNMATSRLKNAAPSQLITAHGSPSKRSSPSKYRRNSTAASESRSLQQRRQWLDTAIPKLLLARAAQGHSAHTRALKYFEQHSRELLNKWKAVSNASASHSSSKSSTSATPARRPTAGQSVTFTPAFGNTPSNGVTVPEDWPSDTLTTGAAAGMTPSDIEFIQQIYASIDDPDGLAGIRSLRPVASISEQIRELESGGRWAEALTAYDQALQMQPTSVEYHAGLMTCLRNVGQYHNSLLQVRGATAIYQNIAPTLNAHGVMSAWRLNDFDTVNRLTSTRVDDVFEVALARALHAIHVNRPVAYASHAAHARQLVIAPLQAASFESYQRAYPHILHLHMLQELDQIMQMKIVPMPVSANGHLQHSAAQRNSLGANGMDIDAVMSARSANLKLQLQPLRLSWAARLKHITPSFRLREPLLSLRRVLYSQYGLMEDVAECWVTLAREARVVGQHETAQRALMEAASYSPAMTTLEHAKLLHARGLHHEALMYLEQEIRSSSSLSTASSASNADHRMLRAKLLLLAGRWAEASGARKSSEIKQMYVHAKSMGKSWGKASYYLAQFTDKLVEAGMQSANTKSTSPSPMAFSPSPPNAPLPEQQLAEVLSNYGTALMKSSKYTYLALPRLLTLWFEHGQLWATIPKSSRDPTDARRQQAYGQCHSVMMAMISQLQPYQWLTAMPQIISRFVHPHPQLVEFMRAVVVAIFKTYPQQAVWHMAAVTRTSDSERKRRAREIIDSVNRSVTGRATACVREAETLFNLLIDLTQGNLHPKQFNFTLKKELPALARYSSNNVIVPLLASMTVTLPTNANPLTASATPTDQLNTATAAYSAFPSDLPTIQAFDDKFEVYKSKERPRVIKIIGDDGQVYKFLAKAEVKGDMRKNSRFMEVGSVINRLLQSEPESRSRGLSMRTFGVSPLTDEAGLIEWVPHTNGLRSVLRDCHGQVGIEMNLQQLQRMYGDAGTTDVAARIRVFNETCNMYPSYFHRWFLGRFGEPTAWYEARLLFARSTAVWSMVGWLVGLGDRHCENILVDEKSGECVHVDFDCLFNKGLTLGEPERVPFRLTANIIDACGFAGINVDGTFRKSAEYTLDVLRRNTSTMMNVLHTFLYDPLVEWKSSQNSQSASQISHSGAIQVTRDWNNADAVKQLSEIDSKLRGHMGSAAEQLANNRNSKAPNPVNASSTDMHTLPLSVQGQVEQLIRDATDQTNLALMYIGWMPWL